MKKNIHNIREIAPITLFSVLLFVSCTQLPVVEDIDSEVASTVDSNVDSTVDSTVSSTDEVVDSTTPEIQPELPELVEESVDQGTAVTTTEPNDENIESISENLESVSPETEVIPDELVAEIVVEAEEEQISAEELARINEEMMIHQRNVELLCEEIGNKLGSVSVEDCLTQQLQFAGSYSVNARPLAMKDFHPNAGNPDRTKILIMGGIHGDEYSSISIMFKWMSILQESGGNNFMWRFLPTVNPDGLLDGQAIRQNASGVDLNRNFPSQDWDATALEYWRINTGENPRRYPGEEAASEPEVRWIIEQIEKFNPEVIVSVHAPYHLLDFDGPSQAPDKIGDLYLHQLGVYPGSLGNYAGLDLGIPVVTLELPSAGIMPSVDQIQTMWIDMLYWLNTRTQNERRAAL